MPIFTNEFINLTVEGLVLFITFLVNLTISLVVFFKNPRKRVNVVFGAMIGSVCLWNITNFLSDSIRIWDISLAIGYWTIGTALFIPAFFLYFSLIFPKEKKIKKWEMLYIFLPSLVILFFIPSEFNIVSQTYEFKERGVYFESGILYIITAIYFIIYMSWAAINLVKKYSEANNNIIKTQIIYIVTGASLAGLVGVVTNAVLPIFNNHDACLFGTPFSIVYGLGVAYAITRYRFMDIKVVLRKSFVYGLGVFMLVGLVVGGGVLIEKVLENYFKVSEAVAIMLGVAFIMVVFPYLKNYIREKMDQWFKKDYIDLSKTFKEFEAQGMITNIRIENFCQELSVEIKHTRKLSSLYFFVLGVQSQKLEQLFPKNKDINIKKDDQLVRILNKTKGIIIKEELSYFTDGQVEKRNGVSELDEKEVKQLIKIMSKKEIEFIVPLKYGGELIGFLSGGKRDDVESFSSEDIEFFEYVQDRTKVVLGQLRQRNNFFK